MPPLLRRAKCWQSTQFWFDAQVSVEARVITDIEYELEGDVPAVPPANQE